MQLNDFCDKLESGNWERLHYYFLDHLRPDVTKAAWAACVEYADALAFALQLPPDMLPTALPPLPEVSPIPLASAVRASLWAQGVSPDKLTAEEAVLLLRK